MVRSTSFRSFVADCNHKFACIVSALDPEHPRDPSRTFFGVCANGLRWVHIVSIFTTILDAYYLSFIVVASVNRVHLRTMLGTFLQTSFFRRATRATLLAGVFTVCNASNLGFLLVLAAHMAHISQAQIRSGECDSTVITDPNISCAFFDVPLDYANASAGTGRLALAKAPATTQPRLGTVFFNPGEC